MHDGREGGGGGLGVRALGGEKGGGGKTKPLFSLFSLVQAYLKGKGKKKKKGGGGNAIL